MTGTDQICLHLNVNIEYKYIEYILINAPAPCLFSENVKHVFTCMNSPLLLGMMFLFKMGPTHDKR